MEPTDLLVLRHYLWEKPTDRTAVEATLTRMCVNPLQDKVDNIRAMAAEAKADFDAAVADKEKANAGSKALIKLRGELVRLYLMQQDVLNAA